MPNLSDIARDRLTKSGWDIPISHTQQLMDEFQRQTGITPAKVPFHQTEWNSFLERTARGTPAAAPVQMASIPTTPVSPLTSAPAQPAAPHNAASISMTSTRSTITRTTPVSSPTSTRVTSNVSPANAPVKTFSAPANANAATDLSRGEAALSDAPEMALNVDPAAAPRGDVLTAMSRDWNEPLSVAPPSEANVDGAAFKKPDSSGWSLFKRGNPKEMSTAARFGWGAAAGASGVLAFNSFVGVGHGINAQNLMMSFGSVTGLGASLRQLGLSTKMTVGITGGVALAGLITGLLTRKKTVAAKVEWEFKELVDKSAPLAAAGQVITGLAVGALMTGAAMQKTAVNPAAAVSSFAVSPVALQPGQVLVDANGAIGHVLPGESGQPGDVRVEILSAGDSSTGVASDHRPDDAYAPILSEDKAVRQRAVDSLQRQRDLLLASSRAQNLSAKQRQALLAQAAAANKRLQITGRSQE
jgi:hypothetical protein